MSVVRLYDTIAVLISLGVNRRSAESEIRSDWPECSMSDRLCESGVADIAWAIRELVAEDPEDDEWYDF